MGCFITVYDHNSILTAVTNRLLFYGSDTMTMALSVCKYGVVSVDLLFLKKYFSVSNSKIFKMKTVALHLN